MRSGELSFATAEERPDLVDEMLRVGASPWPEFLNHDAVVNVHWRSIYDLAPDCQFAMLEVPDGDIAAVANCIPVRWDAAADPLPDRGIDAALEDGLEALHAARAPRAVCALMIVVAPKWLGRGLSSAAIKGMGAVARRRGLRELVAPVRATEKHRYPLTPMERYIQWRRADGTAFDPWIRVHERVGGEIVGAAPAAMYVEGSAADWESWTGMAMPETGSYIVPEALVPVEIDRERDVGEYREPACWVRHRVPFS